MPSPLVAVTPDLSTDPTFVQLPVQQDDAIRWQDDAIRGQDDVIRRQDDAIKKYSSNIET